MRIFLIPGLMGSALDCPDSFFPDNLWVNYTRLALCHLDYLKLASDGASPDPDIGRPCYENGILSQYYAMIQYALERDPGQEADTIHGFGYDFRLSALVTGRKLAEQVRSLSEEGAPCALVAHSFGGLVARVCWSELLRTGDQGLIRRIITIGTPHLGSYGIPVLWSLGDRQLVGLWTLKTSVKTIFLPGGLIGARPVATLEKILQVTASWPSCYELLPVLYPGYESLDPRRADLYDLGNWPPGRGISQALLDHARGPWREFLIDPDSLPPPEILTVVAGTGFLTPERLGDLSRLGYPAPFSETELGDYRVTVASAAPQAGHTVLLSAEHTGILQSPWLLANIGRLLKEDNSGPGPGSGQIKVSPAAGIGVEPVYLWPTSFTGQSLATSQPTAGRWSVPKCCN